jgi:molecular chaperone HtpG
VTDSQKENFETFELKTEIRQLLDILIHSLYKEREIFLRELISNASDALTRIHFEMLTNQDVLDPDAELAIHIDVTEEEGVKNLVIKDSGIGMTREELIRNLGTIAQSGAREFLEIVKNEEAKPDDIIGQFGVGFYSVFMVADEVTVVSQSYKNSEDATSWASAGGDEFRIEPADKNDRGTEIHITLKEDAGEFANEWTIKQVVKRYSDFIGYPIYVGDDQANQQQPLWRRSTSEATEEDYKQFYQQMTMDFEEPISTIHLASDAPLHIRSLLFIPAKRERSMLNLRTEPGVKLYAHNVLIQEYCQDLLPKWLEFVDGVVDSEDLPLNVSRESIQNTRVLRRLGKSIRQRVLRELESLAQEAPDRYDSFWSQYGRVLKEGIAIDADAKNDIMPLLRFYSTRSTEQQISLDTYIDRMKESQDDIFYVLGEDKESVAFSPHLDPLTANDLEVLFLIDPLDPFITPILQEYKDRKLQNISEASLELPDVEEPNDELTQEAGPTQANFNRFIGRCVTTLGERIIEVRESKILRSSPVRLVPPDDDSAGDMQRVFRYMDQNYEVPKRIFEINRKHELIIQLTKIVSEAPDDDLINIAIEQLYESALVVEGLHPNPSSMLPRIQDLLQIVVDRTADEFGDELVDEST